MHLYAYVSPGYLRSMRCVHMFMSTSVCSGMTIVCVCMLAAVLASTDRPMDLLNVLKSLVAANQRLPRAAMRPISDPLVLQRLSGAVPGATIATVWLPSHYDYMRTHKDAGMGGTSTAGASLRALMEQAMELEVGATGPSELSICIGTKAAGPWPLNKAQENMVLTGREASRK